MTYEDYLNLFDEIKNTSSNLELLNKLKEGNINPNFMLIFIWFIISIILNLIGFRLIKKYENSYSKVM